MLALVEQEITQREENQQSSRIRKAGFPVVKSLDGFDFHAAPYVNKPKVLGLAKCDFVDAHENVLLVGNSGTGKTHLAIGLGLSACRKGYHVRFWTAAGLVNELAAARGELRLSKLEKQWLRYDLVILDELGYVPLNRTEAELLFQFCSARYERGSLLITSNLEFGEWNRVFNDEKLTVALLDRLTHRAHIVEMNGESYRFRETVKKAELETK